MFLKEFIKLDLNVPMHGYYKIINLRYYLWANIFVLGKRRKRSIKAIV
jgi:hypothetical protein